jgi:hypothetical protein
MPFGLAGALLEMRVAAQTPYFEAVLLGEGQQAGSVAIGLAGSVAIGLVDRTHELHMLPGLTTHSVGLVVEDGVLARLPQTHVDQDHAQGLPAGRDFSLIECAWGTPFASDVRNGLLQPVLFGPWLVLSNPNANIRRAFVAR